MTTPICEYQGVLQEWAPETRLLFQIPPKALRGIFSQDLKLTCVDVVAEFITLGTNCGLVYWYCRETAELQRLRIENTNCSVTCVKIVSTVDFMVAAGTDVGNITVFQIPKKFPESLPQAMKPKNKQIERFSIDGLHKGAVSCLEWSSSGMKLFSGDKTGIVVLTSIDYETNISKSTVLLNEKFEVVQLSYDQSTLLVSTVYRTIICDGDANWNVMQLGTKERKVLGKFGATFCKFDHGTVIYASRPGQRLWLADKKGTVEQTLIFKTAIQSSHPKVTLINPLAHKEPSDRNFGKIVQFGDGCLVCYQSEILYILHPASVTVVSSLDCARKILDVAVNKDEIYILEGDRSLLRIGYAPDSYVHDMVDDITNRRRSLFFDDIANKIKDTAGTFKRITTELISSNDKESPPALADEALNLPPIKSLPMELFATTVPENNVEIHESFEEPIKNTGAIRKILKPSYPEEEFVIRPGRRRKKTKNIIQQGAESESDSMSTTSEDRLVCGYVNEPSVSEESPSSWSQSQSGFSLLSDIQSLLNLPHPNAALKPLPETPKSPDDRSQISLDTCESVSENLGFNAEAFREEQEKTFIRLANQEFSMMDSLNSDRTENMSISVNITASSSASSKLSENGISSEISENVSMVSECDDLPQLPQPEPQNESLSISSGNSQIQENKEMILSQILGLDLEDPLNQFRPKEEQECETPVVENQECLLPDTEVDRKLASIDSLCYGPPSGSSLLSSCHPSLDLNTGPTCLTNPQLQSVEKSDCWLQYQTPNGIVSLSVCDNYVVCTTALDAVYYSQLGGISLKWTALDYKANSVAMSRNGKLIWVMGTYGLRALVKPSMNGPFSDTVEPVASNVKSFSVDDDVGIYVTLDGKIKWQRKLIRVPMGLSEDVPCPFFVNSVVYRDGILMAITTDEMLICKQSNSADFGIICTPSPIVRSVAMGPEKLVWIVDADNKIYFSDDFLSKSPNWWEVLISEYIFNNPVEPFLKLPKRVIKVGMTYALNQTKQTFIAANDSSVWMYKKNAPFVHVNKNSFTGYIWQDIELKLNLKWKLLSVAGVFEEKGRIWLLSSSNDLFCLGAENNENFQSVSNPTTSEIICISSAHHTMWVLSEEGIIYARLGLTDSCLIGNTWRTLLLPQLADLRLIWVSCGCDVAWCVDMAGRIFMTLVPPYDMATNVFEAAWVEIEDTPKDVFFTKVFVGPNSMMVWALDHEEQIYVREGIFSNHQIGTGWVHVAGISAKYLTISSTAVWATTKTGDIYRRHGISENNYIGDYWRRVPGKLNSLSVTFNDDLWGISILSGLTRLRQRKFLFQTKNDEIKNLSIEDDDLVIID